MLALVVDMMNQISLTTRLALTGFQASWYSHHRSESALGETNWLLRVSRCNLTDEGLTPTKDGGTCLRRLSMFRKEVH